MIPTTTRNIRGFAVIPSHLAIIAVLALLNIATVFEPPHVLTGRMNNLFIGIIPLIIVYIAARVFARSWQKKNTEGPGPCSF